MNEEGKDLLKRLLVEEDVFSDEIEINGIKFQFKLIQGEDWYRIYSGVNNLNDMKDIMLLNTNRLAAALYKIDNILFSDLVKEKFEDDNFENRVKFINKLKIDLKSKLIAEYIAFEDKVSIVNEDVKKNF